MIEIRIRCKGLFNGQIANGVLNITQLLTVCNGPTGVRKIQSAPKRDKAGEKKQYADGCARQKRQRLNKVSPEKWKKREIGPDHDLGIVPLPRREHNEAGEQKKSDGWDDKGSRHSNLVLPPIAFSQADPEPPHTPPPPFFRCAVKIDSPKNQENQRHNTDRQNAKVAKPEFEEAVIVLKPARSKMDNMRHRPALGEQARDQHEKDHCWNERASEKFGHVKTDAG